EEMLELFTDPGFREMGVVAVAVLAYEFEYLLGGISAPRPAGLAAGAYVQAVKFRRKLLGRTDEEIDQSSEGERLTRALFWDIGMRFSAKFKAGPSSSSPSKITFRTTYDLNPSDFNHATFYTITGKLLSAGNSFVSVDGPNSAVMVMTVATTRGSP